MKKSFGIVLAVLMAAVCSCSMKNSAPAKNTAAENLIPDEPQLTEGPVYELDVVHPDQSSFPFYSARDVDENTIITIVVTNEELNGETLEHLVNNSMHGCKFRLDLSRIKRFTNSAWGKPVSDNAIGWNYAMITNDDLVEVVFGAQSQVRFDDCSNLKKVTYTGSEILLADGGFSNCTGLKSVVFPENCTISTDKGYTFYNCSSLQNIQLPPLAEGREPAPGIFNGCTGLVVVNLPDNIPSVPKETFKGCSSLKSVDLKKVHSVGKDAFADCASLESLIFPDDVTEIEDAVRGCTSLKTLQLGPWISSFNLCFTGCRNLSKVQVKKNPAVLFEKGMLTNSDRTSLYLVTDKAVRKGTFEVPDTIGYVAPGAFSACSAVREVSNLPSLSGGSEFYECPGIQSVSFRDTAEKIGYLSFYGCTSLNSVTVPESITAIDSGAFAGCTALQSVALHDGMYLGYDVFRDCTALKNVVLPADLYELPHGIFRNTGIDSLECLESCLYLEDAREFCFDECVNLVEAVLPENLISTGFGMFWECRNLKKAVLPDSLERIRSSTFRGCTALTDINLPDGLTEIDEDAFRDCTSLAELTLPVSLQVIQTQAFMNCAGLTSLVIPSSVTEIGARFIAGCLGITEITIPASVTSFSLISGFEGAEYLSVIRYEGTREQLLENFACAYEGPAVICSNGEVTGEELQEEYEAQQKKYWEMERRYAW